MKKNIKTLIILVASVASTLGANAQSVISAGGAEMENADAKVTVTIGESTIGAEGNAEIGFQQAYDSETVSVEETVSPLQLSLYPNPTVDKVTVQNPELLNLKYELTTLDGKLILSDENSLDTLSFDLSDKPAGMYIVRFTDTQTNLTKTYKIIKK